MGRIIGETADVFDESTGLWLGVLDRFGREQLVPLAGSVGNRVALIGDSLLARSFQSININSSSGFVVSSGIATINTSSAGNHNLVPGNKAHLFNTGDANYANSMNGIMADILTTPSATTATFSATQNGVRLADGDYSQIGGAQWQVNSLLFQNNGSWFRWLNALTGSQYSVICTYAIGGTTSAISALLLTKIMQGPTFDIAVVGVGTNDINITASAAAANAAAMTAQTNIERICDALLAAGKTVYLAVPPPLGAAISAGNPTFKNIAMAQLRYSILKYCRDHSQIICIDLFKHMIDGNSVTGDIIAGYVNTSSADSVHPSVIACINIAKNEIAANPTIYRRLNDIQPVTILDDYINNTANHSGAPYPNILQNGLFTGTGGTVNAPATGSAANSWIIENVTGTLAGVGGAARTSTTNTNSANWGTAQTLNASGASAGQGFTFRNSAALATYLAGKWWRAGITIKALADFAHIRELYLQFYLGTTGGGYAMGSASDATDSGTVNLKSGDIIQIVTEPIYVPSQPSSGLVQFVLASSAAGWAANMELSSAFVRQVANPYQ